jgi:hypothetical protein
MKCHPRRGALVAIFGLLAAAAAILMLFLAVGTNLGIQRGWPKRIGIVMFVPEVVPLSNSQRHQLQDGPCPMCVGPSGQDSMPLSSQRYRQLCPQQTLIDGQTEDCSSIASETRDSFESHCVVAD